MGLCSAGCGALPSQTNTQTADQQTVTKSNFQLDTFITITLYDWTDSSTLDLAFDEIERLENLLSVDREGSDLDRLAQAAGKAWVDISPETQEVLTAAKEYYTLSGGVFDVTTGPLIDLWDIHDLTGHYPTDEELAQTLPLIGSDDLLVEDGRAYLAREGMIADLGAIAKGYIADQVKALLLDQGVEHAVLDLGRNILLIGGKTEDTPFTVGVQDPNEDQGTLISILRATDKSIVTSGVYERYFEYEGKRYHHILDPTTGFPADNGLASVTIISDDSTQGDALSTTCLLLGLDQGLALIESIDGVEAMFIDNDDVTTMSSGFSAYLAEQ
jgi:thiamine biosynthesis lipoprotein